MIARYKIVLSLALWGIFIIGGLSFTQIPMDYMADPAFMMQPGVRPDTRRPQEMITCPECGTESPIDTEFCPQCAYDLEGVRPVDPDVDEVEEVEVPKITVIEGDLIICRITGKVLEEPVKREVPITEQENYELLDEDEEIYGNITRIDDIYIGPAVNLYRRRIVDVVDQAMQMDALQFAGEFAASITDRSALESRYDLELTQMDILTEFRDVELRQFRVNPDDPFSDFHPVYMPLKPLLPDEEQMERMEREAAPAARQPGMMPDMYMMDPAAPRGAGQIGLQRAREVDQRR